MCRSSRALDAIRLKPLHQGDVSTDFGAMAHLTIYTALENQDRLGVS